MIFEEVFDDYLRFEVEDWRGEHHDNVSMMHDELTKLGSRLSKSQSFFAKTVRLRVHFDVFPNQMEQAPASPSMFGAKVLAYLTWEKSPRYQGAVDGMLLLAYSFYISASGVRTSSLNSRSFDSHVI